MWGYRLGLSATAAAIALCSLLVLLDYTLPQSAGLQPTLRCMWPAALDPVPRPNRH